MKVLGLILGVFVSLPLMWLLFPFLSESMKAISDNPILGQGERGAVLLIPAIFILVVIIGFALMLRRVIRN